MVLGLRWVPSLGVFTHSPGFFRLRRAVIEWVDEHFERIERDADWLNPIRQETMDACVTSLATGALQIASDPPTVTCHRAIRRFYGVDGILPERLASLASALFAAGWGYLVKQDTLGELKNLGEQHPPVTVNTWLPVPGFTVPPILRALRPLRKYPLWHMLNMDIHWAASSRLAGLTPPGGGYLGPAAYLGPARRRSPLYRFFEDTTGQATSPARSTPTPTQHEHELAITINLTYYSNTNPNWIRGFIPRRLLPIIEARANRFD